MKVFLFPHQDDEFGAFHVIDRAVDDGDLLIVYLTDGAYGGTSAQTRRAESEAVLHRLGVRDQQIWFLGEQLAVPNLGLRHHLERLISALDVDLAARAVETIYVPAWEGGHPDHDAAVLLALKLASSNGEDPATVSQFPMYSAYRCWARPYRVLTPIREAGVVENTNIPWNRRMAHLGLCLMYPSQKQTFLGLFPFILWHYLARGVQQLQAVRPSIVHDRPHSGALLYERRGWLSWSQFEQEVGPFRGILPEERRSERL